MEKAPLVSRTRVNISSPVDFDQMYAQILNDLAKAGSSTVNRKGDTLTELSDYKFKFQNPFNCFANRRDPSVKYLEGEFDWYISGDCSLEKAMELSKFWKQCSDDGCTVNSNYGYLLFHDKNTRGLTQFEHALQCIVNSKRSKKAVMTLYNKEHGYLSNDNPCTMFLRLWVDSEDALNLSVNMRSSDVYFGLPYDVPFFCFVLYAAWRVLVTHHPELTIGNYTHIAGSLHKYSRNDRELIAAQGMPHLSKNEAEAQEDYFRDFFEKMYVKLCDTVKFRDQEMMTLAWVSANSSQCLKKKVGAVISDVHGNPIALGHGGKEGEPCKECVRGNSEDEWYGDECPSVHSEMRAVIQAYNKGMHSEFDDAIVYVTHGPCDACLKLLDLVGVREVVWDEPYKTDYGHWPRIRVRKCLKLLP